MWIRNTEETEAVHIPDIKKETVLDGFVYPFKAICQTVKNGKIFNLVNGCRLVSTEITTKKTHRNVA
jgi:hypothetical protein